MKTLKLMILIVSVCTFWGCEEKTYHKLEYSANVPIYMARADFENTIQYTSAQPFTQPGRLHYHNGLLFILDKEKGIHIIDNRNPYSPVVTGFIEVPVIKELSAANNRLYCNSGPDLLTFDISDHLNPTLLSRVENVLELYLPQSNPEYPNYQTSVDSGIVVSWEVKEIKEKVLVDDNWGGGPIFMEGDAMITNGGNGGSSVASPNISTGGSLSGFGIAQDYLYVLETNAIHTFSLGNPDKPDHTNTENTWRTVETIYPTDDYLFLGTTTGMLIYDISAPWRPVYKSSVNHWTGCDPVVVQGDFAYVTLRSGGPCGDLDNQMDIVNISDIQYPYIEKSILLSSPYGVGVDGDVLFVCERENGFKVFDNSNPAQMPSTPINTFSSVSATDVIPLNGFLMMVADGGIYQYTYDQSGSLDQISHLSVSFLMN